MDIPLRSLIVIVGCVILLIPATYAQQADTTQLPEIAPREIEILGERQIALPSLERQPLTGFAAPPSIPTVPADRRPYIEPYKQELGDLPESLPLPETVAEPLQPAPEPAHGFVEGGGGRYVSRFLEGRLLAPVTSHERFSLHGAYRGMEGFSPSPGSSFETPSDVARARIRFESERDPIRLEATLHGSAERYLLYGASFNPGEAVRDGYSAGSSLEVRSTGSVPARASLQYARTAYTSDIAVALTGGNLDFRQDLLGLEGSVTAPASLRPHVEGSYNRSWFGGDPSSDTGYGFDATGTLSFFRSDSTTLEVGATILGFDTPAQHTTTPSPRVGATYIAPYVHAEWRMSEHATVHLRNQPRRHRSSLHDLYALNPYSTFAPSLRPTLETTNTELGLTFTSGYVRMRAAGGFRYAPTYQYFEPDPQDGGIFEVHYGSARILRGRGQIALQGVEGVQASLGLSVRDGSLENGNTPIPNFAPVTADAMLTVSFAGGRGYLEALSHFESPRYVTRNANTRLGSYVTLDLEGSFALSSNIDVLARAENLAPEAPTLWAGYPRPPAQILAGLRIHW